MPEWPHRLRINGTELPLPAGLHGERYQYTAIMRGQEYMPVALEGSRLPVSNPAMRQLLRAIETSPEGSSILKAMCETLGRMEAVVGAR